MEISTTTLILVGVICLVLGFFASVLINTLREDDGALADETPAPPGGRKGRYAPVARLWREKKSGALVVELDGSALIGSSALNDEQRARLEQSARDLRDWLGMAGGQSGPASAPTSGVAAPTAGEVTAGAGAAAGAASAAGAAYAAAVDALPAAGSTVAALPPPTPQVRKAGGTAAAAAPAPVVPGGAKSIVMQIDDILQEMLAGGSLAGLGIHLFEDPKMGVMVKVGSNNYEGIDSVSDAEIKAALRAAVKRWESSQ